MLKEGYGIFASVKKLNILLQGIEPGSHITQSDEVII
jgi:hypothetical protein